MSHRIQLRLARAGCTNRVERNGEGARSPDGKCRFNSRKTPRGN